MRLMGAAEARLVWANEDLIWKIRYCVKSLMRCECVLRETSPKPMTKLIFIAPYLKIITVKDFSKALNFHWRMLHTCFVFPYSETIYFKFQNKSRYWHLGLIVTTHQVMIGNLIKFENEWNLPYLILHKH